MTTKEWLEKLSNSDISNSQDDTIMEKLLHDINFPKCKVTCGIVYLDGYGECSDIHTVAKQLLKISNNFNK